MERGGPRLLAYAVKGLRNVNDRGAYLKCVKNFSSSSSSSSSSASRLPTSTTLSTRMNLIGKGNRSFHSITSSTVNQPHAVNTLSLSRRRLKSIHLLQIRCMNRNARRPKKANRGKRPCSHARRHAKRGNMKSRGYAVKYFGFW